MGFRPSDRLYSFPDTDLPLGHFPVLKEKKPFPDRRTVAVSGLNLRDHMLDFLPNHPAVTPDL